MALNVKKLYGVHAPFCHEFIFNKKDKDLKTCAENTEPDLKKREIPLYDPYSDEKKPELMKALLNVLY